MVKIHKEGRNMLLILLFALIILNGALLYVSSSVIITSIVAVLSIVVFIFFTYFFRISNRILIADDTYVIAPADGKIVVIEPVMENDYFHEQRMQVSIFMSVFNVHANWFPVAGKVLHSSHQSGRKMAAYLPKSSTENERSSIIIEAKNGQQILVRQVAGALARRIVTYAKEGMECHINQQLGFIKFGSRVDMYLPMDAEILTELHEETIGNETIIAKLKHQSAESLD
ncbi:MAG: phosphatidylserine decarboxylase family protein [Paludibacteraceae bacterium]|nr:phosphatidylserine decarboxylase family protein [Paludibacteraceae bacterium]